MKYKVALLVFFVGLMTNGSFANERINMFHIKFLNNVRLSGDFVSIITAKYPNKIIVRIAVLKEEGVINENIISAIERVVKKTGKLRYVRRHKKWHEIYRKYNLISPIYFSRGEELAELLAKRVVDVVIVPADAANKLVEDLEHLGMSDKIVIKSFR